MKAYWDASAVLALIFNEPNSAAASLARERTREVYAWSWMRVELAAGCARRRAHAGQRAALDRFLTRTYWIDIPSADFATVASANETWRLRAPDAGHLFALRRLAQVDPSTTLVCFDVELAAAARAEGLRVWSP